MPTKHQTVPEPELRPDGENRNLKSETEKGATVLETLIEDKPVSASLTESNERSKLIEQYGCGPVRFTGTSDALYERHLVFDNVMEAAEIGARERFEAIARSVRDGLGYEYGMFKQTMQDGWQHEVPDNWIRYPDPWEIRRQHETVNVPLNCSFELRGGTLRAVLGRPSALIGIPFDRPVVGYGGKTINTLRLWAAAAHDYFNFQEFSSGDFVGALAETLEAESLTRVLYPDDHTALGQGLRFVQEYFLVACSLADLVRRFRKTNTDWQKLPDKVAIQLNDTHPTMAVPELMRILLDE